jgi:hypothetical protein
MNETIIEPNPKQFRVLQNHAAREIYYVGGWGSGKSWTISEWQLDRSARNTPRFASMVVTLTTNTLETVIIPELEQAFERWGCRPQYNASKKLFVWTPEQRRIWLRTAEHPKRAEGPSLTHVSMDECGQTKLDMYHRLSSRTRAKKTKVEGGLPAVRQRLFAGRPEGTRTWFNRHIKAIEEGRRKNGIVVRGETLDNPHNDEEYIDDINMIVDGDEALADQVLRGIARDESGNIYGVIPPACLKRYDRMQGGRVVVGWDFNVGHMVTPIGVWFEQRQCLHIIGECVSAETRFPEFDGHPTVRVTGPDGALTSDHAMFLIDSLLRDELVVYQPGQVLCRRTREEVQAAVDASGDDRASNAEMSDIQMVREAGFLPKHDKANPRVRDRIAAVRLALRRKRLFIDPKRAPLTLAALRGHARIKGEPQKDFGRDLQLDHYCDALGYMVWRLMPLKRTNERTGTRR